MREVKNNKYGIIFVYDKFKITSWWLCRNNTNWIQLRVFIVMLLDTSEKIEQDIELQAWVKELAFPVSQGGIEMKVKI